MNTSEITDNLDLIISDPLETLKIMESDKIWKTDEKSVFKIACHLHKKGRMQDVLNFINIAEGRDFIFIDERLMSMQHMRVDALLEIGKYDEAILVYKNILSVGPDYVAYNNLALAHWNKGEFADAFENYVRAINLNETDPISFRGAGEMLNLLNRSEEAIPYLIAAVTIDQKYLLALRALGVAYFNSGYWEGAYRSFKRVISLDPNDQIAIDGLLKLDIV